MPGAVARPSAICVVAHLTGRSRSSSAARLRMAHQASRSGRTTAARACSWSRSLRTLASKRCGPCPWARQGRRSSSVRGPGWRGWSKYRGVVYGPPRPLSKSMASRLLTRTSLYQPARDQRWASPSASLASVLLARISSARWAAEASRHTIPAADVYSVPSRARWSTARSPRPNPHRTAAHACRWAVSSSSGWLAHLPRHTRPPASKRT